MLRKPGHNISTAQKHTHSFKPKRAITVFKKNALTHSASFGRSTRTHCGRCPIHLVTMEAKCTHIFPRKPKGSRALLSLEMSPIAFEPMNDRGSDSALINLLQLFVGRDPFPAWNLICLRASRSKRLASEDAKLFFMELSVDAFLNHDYGNARSFYGVYLLAKALLREKSTWMFLQSSLTPIYVGDPELRNVVTPWGAKYVGFPKSMSMQDIMLPFLNFKKLLHRVYESEAELLEEMLSNPDITCGCLNAEDPYHPEFGRFVAGANLGFPIPTSKKGPQPYIINCAFCQKLPGEKKFPRCSKCRRVRYCSKECQQRHWPQHKPKCERKTADWWGKAHVASKRIPEHLDIKF